MSPTSCPLSPASGGRITVIREDIDPGNTDTGEKGGKVVRII
jgi:hypothetical protein